MPFVSQPIVGDGLLYSLGGALLGLKMLFDLASCLHIPNHLCHI